MANRHLLLLALLCVTTQAASSGYYTVSAPKVLRPNSEYHVVVSTQMVSQSTTVEVVLEGAAFNGGIFESAQTVTVEPDSTKIIQFEIPDLEAGTYNLTARGIEGLKFENTTTLNYVHKSYSVFIQTDKAMYKPGQKVQFRAIALDMHLKPSVAGALEIFITDGKGNRVKQWPQARTANGVFSGELQLSEFPVLGDWIITVSLLGETFQKTFEVAEYVLPKFEVTVDAPEHATFSDSHIVANVHAKYTYGEAVEGQATVTVSLYSGTLMPTSLTSVSKIVPIDGDVAVEIDIAKDLTFATDSDSIVQVDVSVEEALTGKIQNTSFDVTLHKYKYKMELIKTSEYFKPGLKYTVFVKVAYYDGSPVQDEKNPVIVRYGFTYDQSLYIEEKHQLSEDGLLELNFYPPMDSNQTVLEIRAQYLDLTEEYLSVSPSTSPSNTFIQAVLITQNPTVNQDIELDINSTESMKYVSYQVISRGDVIVANTVQMYNKNTQRLKFLATYDMAPTAHVVVYSVRDDGEVVADAVDVELDGIFQNFVNINVNPTEAQPGGKVEMTIETKPNSYVSLLAVDQSVLLLKSGNDITQEIITEELKTYDTGSETQSVSPFVDFIGKRSLFWWPSSATAGQVFENSGSVILTNGLVPEYIPYIRYPLMFEKASGGGVDIETAVNKGNTGTSVSAGPVRVRRNFPETWLWQMFEAGVDGKQTIQETAPDTITSWVITGFSLDPLYGLGLSGSPGKLTVFRPFFISLDLPYSVLRGEVVSIPVVVFNYMTQDVVADVTLENEELQNFEFVDMSNDVNGQSKLEPNRRKQVTVKANSGSTVSFMVIPKKLGQVTVKVTATSSLAVDAVVMNLLVEPEGETHYLNKAVLVDLKNKKNFDTTIILEMPKSIVEGSDRVEISAVGDLLGPSLTNLDNLIRMPYGCGEQNMLNFVPNIVVIEYLKNTKQLTSEIEVKALQYMEIGYQRELTYRHSDGSFSAFGESDPSGSTWLTAFVAKSFKQAMPYITIDEDVIKDALYWLSANQSPGGNFPEVGEVVHKDMQGDAGNGLALTAYALTAFLENQDIDVSGSAIKKALDYIVKNLDGVDDIYALALSNYALNLAEHSLKDTVFNMFESKAQTSGDMKWWVKPVQKDDNNPWYSLPNSVDVEMTAYGLLTYLQRGLVQEALPIMKWLMTQRNEQGGFASTQDTVIGLHALAKLSELLYSSDTDITLTFSYPGGTAIPIKINNENSMILQKQELPANVRTVEITASGTGYALVQVSYQYNLDVTGDWPLFTLNPNVDKKSDKNHLYLSICSGFVGSQGVTESNMAVMEVTLPSGFTVDSDTLPTLKATKYVKRVETKNGDTVVVLYFDKMTKEEYCVTVTGFRTHKVAKQKPVPVIIYDYYDASRRATVFYEPTAATLCDICEGEDCGTSCSK